MADARGGLASRARRRRAAVGRARSTAPARGSAPTGRSRTCSSRAWEGLGAYGPAVGGDGDGLARHARVRGPRGGRALEDPCSALLPGALSKGAATEEDLMRRARIELIEVRVWVSPLPPATPRRPAPPSPPATIAANPKTHGVAVSRRAVLASKTPARTEVPNRAVFLSLFFFRANAFSVTENCRKLREAYRTNVEKAQNAARWLFFRFARDSPRRPLATRPPKS